MESSLSGEAVILETKLVFICSTLEILGSDLITIQLKLKGKEEI